MSQNPEIKCGKTTTEFHLTLMSSLIGAVLVLFGALLAAGVVGGNTNAGSIGNTLIMVGAGLIGVTNAGYGISRGIAKTAAKPQPKQDPGVFD